MTDPTRYGRADHQFLVEAGSKILLGTHVASITAAQLAVLGIDATRLELLLRIRAREAVADGYRFKLIDADPETPDNFGVLVRRAEDPA